jgi:tetratricopeptide (TPR) repeat protein
MKRLTLIILALILSTSISYSQSVEDKIESAVKNQEYLEAASYIQEAMKDRKLKKDHDFMALCGSVYYELDILDSAKLCYKLAIQADNDQDETLRTYALVLAELKEFEEAYEYIEDAIDEDKDDPENYLALGNIYILADSLKRAGIQITKAREMDKENPRAFIALGNLYFAQQIYELSKNNYEEALSLDPKNIQARIKLATSYYWLANREADAEMRNDLFGKSIAEWNIISKEDPKNAKAFYEQGRMLYYAQKYGKAASALNKYAELRPNGAQGRWLLAQSLYELRECDTAEVHLKWCAEHIDTVKVKSELLLARCYHDKKDYDKSRSTYEAVRANHELKLPDLQNLALASLFSGDTTIAISYFKEFLVRDPSQCKIAELMAKLTIFRVKDFESAHFFTSKMIVNCEDKKASGFFMDGMAYFYKKKNDTACSAFIESLKIDPTNLRTKLYYADALAAQELNDSSIAVFNSIIDEASKDTTVAENKAALAQSFSKLAGLVFKLKQYKNLETVTVRWTTLLPENEYAWLYRAISRQGQNDAPGACKNYRQVLKINPKNTVAKDNLKKLGC